MKSTLLSLLVFGCLTGVAMADGSFKETTVTPVSEQQGNKWQAIAVTAAVNMPVLISSAPANAVWRNTVVYDNTQYNKGTNLGIASWRFREIVNNSNGGLLLMPERDTFAVYSATVGIHLSSGTNMQPMAGCSQTLLARVKHESPPIPFHRHRQSPPGARLYACDDRTS